MPLETVWFRRGDGQLFEASVSSAVYAAMTADKAFTRIEGSPGGEEIKADADPEKPEAATAKKSTPKKKD